MEDETDLLKFKNKTFFSILRENSISQQDPVPEWRVVNHVDGDGSSTCICTTPILHQYVIQNKENGRLLTIGSECVKRWSISFTCKECESPLGNITQRLLKQNFLCPSCTRQLKIRTKLEEAKQNARERTLANYRLYCYGPYYNKRFIEVISDKDYIEQLLNQRYKSKTLEYFEEYVSLRYDILEVPETGEVYAIN